LKVLTGGAALAAAFAHVSVSIVCLASIGCFVIYSCIIVAVLCYITYQDVLNVFIADRHSWTPAQLFSPQAYQLMLFAQRNKCPMSIHRMYLYRMVSLSREDNPDALLDGPCRAVTKLKIVGSNIEITLCICLQGLERTSFALAIVSCMALQGFAGAGTWCCVWWASKTSRHVQQRTAAILQETAQHVAPSVLFLHAIVGLCLVWEGLALCFGAKRKQ
jgi:hypothetical protein